MNILFHTIAVEPARWTPRRTSRDLVTLLPAIASAGFHRIEVFEPHLTAAPTSPQIRDTLRALDLNPEILSSYLDLNPAKTTPSQVDAKVEEIRQRVHYYGFRAVRIFPGPGMDPQDKAAIAVFMRHLDRLTAALPGTEILLETHDGSLADGPETITQIVRDLGAPSVGLLFQPTLFDPELALRQFAIERPFIRHIHLQNRHPDGSFALLREGVFPWPQIIAQLDENVDATLEFVPAGICDIETFDLAATLLEARSEAAYIREITGEAP